MILSTLLLLVCFMIELSTGTCTRSPILTGYSRFHGESTSTYNLTWQSLSCHSGSIVQYEVNFFGNCSTPPVSIFTRSNITNILINYPYCNTGGCYVRVRGELIDGLFTDYSPCVFIDNQLLHFERHTELYHHVCVPIRGICDNGFVPGFIINGLWIPWPGPDNRNYNATYSQVSRTYSQFCFNNVTEDITLTEYCYQQHTQGCSFCTNDLDLLSHSYIFISVNIARNIISMTALPMATGTTLDLSLHTDFMIPVFTTKASHYSVAQTFKLRPLITPSFGTPFPPSQSTTNILFILAGAVCTGTACILIASSLLATSIKCWYHKKQKKSKQETIYDEPSLPDPIYQEVDIRIADHNNNNMEMTDNHSYMAAAKLTKFDLKECPAYATRHDDLTIVIENAIKWKDDK